MTDHAPLPTTEDPAPADESSHCPATVAGRACRVHAPHDQGHLFMSDEMWKRDGRRWAETLAR